MICKGCKKKFKSTSSTNVFCSGECRNDNRPILRCQFCGESFLKKANNMKYCSDRCAKLRWKVDKGAEVVGTTMICPTCGSSFRKQSGGHKYCTVKCSKHTLRHGMTRDEYIAFISRGCDVCGSVIRLVVDHDHTCCPGKNSCGVCVRGVLCSNCNIAEGMLRGDPVLAMRLAKYMGSGSKQDGNNV